MRPESDKPLPPPPPPKKKDRHIVSWSSEEDELLRQQVSVIDTDNWTSIAAQFKDKTSRQCRRRWYTYLNSEGKKGGWLPEEDMILCEAQKIFGNRWTEIAKVVSGRTDNAVKNRFTTLCKKRAKNDAIVKENSNSSCVNPNNKRVLIQHESAESTTSIKQIRYQVLDQTENHNPNERLRKNPLVGGEQLRPPLSVLDQNISSVGQLPKPYLTDNISIPPIHNGSNSKTEGRFLKRDDPKLTALLQQAELLSSLALKVNLENSNQSLENAWKELRDYLIESGETGMFTTTPDMDFLLDDFEDLIEDLRSSSTGEQLPWRQPSLHEESQSSSECSLGSIQVSQAYINENHTDAMSDQNTTVSCHQKYELGQSLRTSQVESSAEEPKENIEDIRAKPSSEFNSPCQTVPAFKSLTEEIPSPHFSASERQFLLRVLGISSPSPSPSSAQQPSCKRVLLDSL